MFNWIDVSTYSQGERGRILPKNLNLKIDNISIDIFRSVHYNNEWLLNSKDLNIYKYELKVVDMEEAKVASLKIVKEKLNIRIEEYKKVLEQL